MDLILLLLQISLHEVFSGVEFLTVLGKKYHPFSIILVLRDMDVENDSTYSSHLSVYLWCMFLCLNILEILALEFLDKFDHHCCHKDLI